MSCPHCDKNRKPTRYVIEGTWSGYTSSQSRVVHREVATEKFAEEVREKLHGAIYYTDNTALYLTVRPARYRETVKRIDGYKSLIRDCLRHGTNRVADLPPAEERT